MLPQWVQRDLKMLRDERNVLAAARDDHTAVRRAVFRLLLLRQLSAAMEAEDRAVMMQTAALVDVRGQADLWIEGASDAQAAWLDDASLGRGDPSPALQRIARDVFGARIDASALRGGVGGLGRAAARVADFDWDYQTRRGLKQGIARLTGDPPASESVLEALAASLDNVSDSLDTTLPDGPRILMLAVREIDQQIGQRLALLERQSSWLLECDDPWNSPQARVVMLRLHELAALRSALVQVTDGEQFAQFARWKREELLAVAQEVVEGGKSAASMTAQIGRIVGRRGEDETVQDALTAVNWPHQHIVNRVGWRPGRMVGASGWLLVERIRERDALRAVGRPSGSCDAEVRQAAADVLRLVGR